MSINFYHPFRIAGQEGKKATCYNIDVELVSNLNDLVSFFIFISFYHEQII